MVVPPDKKLKIRFHGRIIDHLGIQMYQSPVAALAELISNSWDANAERVEIGLPDSNDDGATIVVRDDGAGMTFVQCQNRYLNVGYGRRADDPSETTPAKGRPVLGRKGIGKFAGFGIAEVMTIDTVSEENGERTVFELDINQLRGEEYVDTEGDVGVKEYEPPSEARKADKGTTITLRKLKLAKKIPVDPFRKSMARRFLLAQRADDFTVRVNGHHLPEDADAEGVEFVFPRDYAPNEKPATLTLDAPPHGEGGAEPEGTAPEAEWGIETLPDGRQVRWRIVFYEDPILEEDLRGIAVYSNGKLAQAPFLFNLTGGLGGQHGQEYVSGQVEADYLDQFPKDVISTERQRINWQEPETQSLLEWGQQRAQQLFRIWKARRAETKMKLLSEKTSHFEPRLQRLPTHERKIVLGALRKLAGLPKLKNQDFVEMGEAMLTAWEGGRLRELINKLAETEDMGEPELLAILQEANVLTALQTAEAVRAKLNVLAGLAERIRNRELENPIRDYVADNPWLLGPLWETYARESKGLKLVQEARNEAGIEKDEDWQGRMDLVLSSGRTLVVLEFMRPGLRVDLDHVARFENYVNTVRTKIEANTGGPFRRAVGFLIADELDKKPALAKKFASMAREEMWTKDWQTLLEDAADKWRGFLEILVVRAKDDRLSALAKDIGIKTPGTNGEKAVVAVPAKPKTT